MKYPYALFLIEAAKYTPTEELRRIIHMKYWDRILEYWPKKYMEPDPKKITQYHDTPPGFPYLLCSVQGKDSNFYLKREKNELEVFLHFYDIENTLHKLAEAGAIEISEILADLLYLRKPEKAVKKLANKFLKDLRKEK